MSKFTPFLLLSTVVATGKLINGNWYADSIERIAYNDLGGAGSYQRVTNMDSVAGTCSKEPRPFAGPLAPFDEDISLHFRGPLVLRQFAAYTSRQGTPGRARRSYHVDFVEEQKLKRTVSGEVIATINVQRVSWFNQYNGGVPAVPAAPTPTVTTGCRVAKRAVGDIVVATINGNVASWINTYDGQEAVLAPTLGASVTAVVTVTVPGACEKTAARAVAPPVVSVHPPAPAQVKPAMLFETPKPSPIPSSSKPAVDEWSQLASFNSDENRSKGVTFLNNKGGQGSGVWDTRFGNSLSYASSDSKTGAASSELFSGSLGSGLDEIAIFSDVSCEKSGDCGYSRPGAVAYKGFSGAQKAFFFEFMMPDDGTGGWNQNMPAIWALNAQIPRTQQYGSCSCWDSGCGEIDIYETLDPGNTRCKSTVHGFVQGGSSDYFVRPTSSFKKITVIFNGDNVVIRELPGDFNFSAGVSAEQIFYLADQGTVVSSVFSLSH